MQSTGLVNFFQHLDCHICKLLPEYCSTSKGGQGVFFPAQSDLQFKAYCDVDWVGCPDTRESLTGYCVFLGDALISWRSKKQSVVSRSFAEAENRSMATTSCEVTWLLYLLKDLHVLHSKPVLMYCDNQVALHIATDLVFHERSKHIEANCHIVRNRILDGTIKTFHVTTKNQLANIFTKALGVDTLLWLLRRLGIINIFAQTIEYPECVTEKEELRALFLRVSVENNERGLAHYSKVQAVLHVETLAQQSRPRPEVKSGCITQASQVAWASRELMDLIEAVPFHKQFIHSW